MSRTPRGTFGKGNPGRPAGARHRVTVAVEALMEGDAKALTKKCIEAAKNGDMTAMRICMERIAPVRKGRPTPFDLPPMTTAADIVPAVTAILKATGEGKLSPDEAQALVAVVDAARRTFETAELAARLDALESRLGDGR